MGWFLRALVIALGVVGVVLAYDVKAMCENDYDTLTRNFYPLVEICKGNRNTLRNSEEQCKYIKCDNEGYVTEVFASLCIFNAHNYLLLARVVPFNLMSDNVLVNMSRLESLTFDGVTIKEFSSNWINLYNISDHLTLFAYTCPLLGSQFHQKDRKLCDRKLCLL